MKYGMQNCLFLYNVILTIKIVLIFQLELNYLIIFTWGDRGKSYSPKPYGYIHAFSTIFAETHLIPKSSVSNPELIF